MTRAGRAVGLGLVVVAALLAGGVALGHAFVVFGELTSVPNPIPPGEPALLSLSMTDQTGVPVEDAVVRAELTPPGGGAAIEVPFEEAAPGVYHGTAVLPSAGEYRVLLRDLTFRQEEVRQTVELPVGGAPFEPVEFLFPPGGSSPALRVWLVWLIGVPLLAGAVVTVLVLRSGRNAEDEG